MRLNYGFISPIRAAVGGGDEFPRAIKMPAATLVKEAYAEAVVKKGLLEGDLSNGLAFSCGDIVPWAKLQSGERVLDLGSGTGAECAAATRIVGPTGRVIGVDFALRMVSSAIRHVATSLLGVSFVLGDAGSLPVKTHFADVVLFNCTLNLFNCALNLLDDRRYALCQAWRVLRRGGRLLILKIILQAPSPNLDTAVFVTSVPGAGTLEQLITEVEEAGLPISSRCGS